MPRREECAFCDGTHGSRPTSHFAGGRCPHRPAAIGAAPPHCKAPSGRGLSAQPTGGEKTPPFAFPSVSASRCHLPRRGRQGENGLPRRFAPRNDSASRCRGCYPRHPTCRGGRLCPPKTRAPCRAGSACPAGKNVSFAAGHMGSALQVISQGAMSTSPRRHLARRSQLGERKRRLLPLPPSALRAATSLAEGGKGRHTGDTVTGSH